MRLLTSAVAAGLAFLATTSFAANKPREPLHETWSFSNPLIGKYDHAQLQRGFQVYKEVCAACHSLKQVAIRDLHDIGFTEDEVKHIAKGYTMTDINPDTGESMDRPGLPTDYFPSPYANPEAAKAANNGAAPPDLSLVVKAREEHAAYVYSLLLGYDEKIPAQAPNSEGKMEKFEIAAGQNYNPWFPGSKIAMAKQLEDGKIDYQDGTRATAKQMAKDVTAFLMWAAEPKLEERHRMGVNVMLFLAVLVGLTYFSYKRIWKDIH
jgi:ubiquinol-cytochrome c reductase cytochrome c1 subunit